MKDYRLKENRQECFKRYYVAQVMTGDIDPAYSTLRWLFDKKFAKTMEDRYWWSFLYGVTYCVPTVFYITSYFPHYPPNLRDLGAWHKENWQKLHYETDRRYCKGHLVEMVSSYRRLVGKNQEDFFMNCLELPDPETCFNIVWDRLSQLNRFGRYSLFYYTETLARCCGFPIECSSMMFGDKGGKSHTNGMLMALGHDSLVDNVKRWSPALLSYLDKHAERLMHLIRTKHPGVPVDRWYMETSLCAFKGLFRRRRYMGYYLDRGQHNLLKMQERTKGEVDMYPLWLLRKQLVPNKYRGEDNGWEGVRKELCDVMMDKGKLVVL